LKLSGGLGGQVPFVGGFDLSLFVTDGAGDLGCNPDIGIDFQISHPLKGGGIESGIGALKLGTFLAVATGGRGDGQALGFELEAGLGGLGGSLGFSASSTEPVPMPNSMKLEGGVMVAAGVNETVTFSLSAGDLARLAAALMMGNSGQRIWGADSGQCDCE
jgi:hypothetical protein